MKRIKINCAPIKTKEDFYEIIGKCLQAPDYFGKNLDALHDILGGADIILEMRNFSNLRAVLGDYASTLESMLNATAEESSNFKVKIKEN